MTFILVAIYMVGTSIVADYSVTSLDCTDRAQEIAKSDEALFVRCLLRQES